MLAAGDITSQRLAARLVPRFIALFPDQVEVAAGTLIKLFERYQDLDGFDKPLEEHTRRDALQGLQSVLLAAASGTPHGCQAVKLILTVLFRWVVGHCIIEQICWVLGAPARFLAQSCRTQLLLLQQQ